MIGDEHIKSHITHYYKGLFGSPEVWGISLEESQISDIPQVSLEENEILTREFTKSEVREAVFQMEHNKAPGPDGFPVEFYQVFLEVIMTF
jgi:hypothetical protein